MLISHIIPAFSLAGYESADTLKDLHRNDFDELTLLAKSIPDMISRLIEDMNIAVDRNQFIKIERLFLGFYSNDSCIFRRGDTVLMLEIAKFVRSKFEANEYNAKGEYSFFLDNNDAAKQTETMNTLVGELFVPDGMNCEVKRAINEEANEYDGNFVNYLLISRRYERIL